MWMFDEKDNLVFLVILRRRMTMTRKFWGVMMTTTAEKNLNEKQEHLAPAPLPKEDTLQLAPLLKETS